MLILEALLLTVLIAVFLLTSYTDCRTSIIENKTLFFSVGIIGILDVLYYALFAKGYIGVFLVNLIFLVFVSIIFYTYHLWAAGDSKLLIVAGLAIPARIYTLANLGIASSFAIIVFIFSGAFLYIIAESLYIGIKEHSLFDVRVGKIDYRRLIISYFAMVATLKVLDILLWEFLGSMLENNPILLQAINFLAVLTLIQYREKISTKQMIIYMFLGWILVLILAICWGDEMIIQPSTDISAWIMVFVIVFVRMIAEKYNYQTINTKDVKAGQILSAATVLAFKTSRVKGLPEGITEDLRSRISEEEAENIKRWEKSKFGKSQIVIVRKIPFAVFIAIGTLAFVVLEVFLA